METTQQNTATRQSGLRQEEEAIICCLLLSENEILNVAPVLKPEMFDSPEMRFIYQAICALNDQGIKADLVTTETEMRKIDEAQFTDMSGRRNAQRPHRRSPLPLQRELHPHYELQ